MGLYIGLISGTSIDGIDAVLISLPESKVIKGITFSYSKDLKNKLIDALKGTPQTPGAFSQLSTLIGREFADATLALLEASNRCADEVIAIGSHGQTICHDAFAEIPYTLQLGCPHTIAEKTGITVVADFRTRDLVLGGQGAPFAPLYHQELFKQQNFPLAIANIGGIANLTFMNSADQVWGFDVGAGNCLLDAWVYEHKGLHFDKDGAWAKTGNIIQELLNSMLEDSYFSLPSPKSIGKEYFSLTWLQEYLKPSYLAEDVQATLVAFTAKAIANCLQQQLANASALLICGGGAHNGALIAELSKLLPGIQVHPTQDLDVNPDFIEASLFAWLAERALASVPLNLKSITGSRSAAILGAIYPKSTSKT